MSNGTVYLNDHGRHRARFLDANVWHAPIALFALFFAMTHGLQAEQKPWNSVVDMTIADTSPLKMVLIQGGKEAGSMDYRWSQVDGAYVIEDRTEMQPNILETARATIDAKTFLPRDIEIDFAIGAAKNVFRLRWDGARRDGSVTVTPENGETRVHDLGGADVPANPIRLSVFGMAVGIPWESGLSVSFPWYNTLANVDEDVVLSHAGITSITVPAGDYEVHKISLTGSATENTLYITTSMPQRIVRIDVTGQPLHFERLPD